ncbi:hypothetical protein ID866_8415 [Astraeus odoratus]|nr:hypothetical protein ID866_8415 [Astraeus odoratus]
MQTAKYQRLPAYSDDEDVATPIVKPSTPLPNSTTRVRNSPGRNSHSSSGTTTSQRPVDPRFNRPPPAAWKRIALILFIVFLFWLSYSLRPKKTAKPEVIYASRYSKEFKYRPAASPIITERLKDGRIRLRGAYPSH